MASSRGRDDLERSGGRLLSTIWDKLDTGGRAILVVLVVVVGIWWLAGGEPGTSTASLGPGQETIGATAAPPSATPTPSATPSATPSVTASPSAIATPTPSELPAFDPYSGLPYVEAADLPAEAQRTMALIDRGGPYPYSADDSTFHNYEGVLPEQPDGYYHEFTVETPGSDDRGARRIVRGANGERYYTDDHYETFARIRR